MNAHPFGQSPEWKRLQRAMAKRQRAPARPRRWGGWLLLAAPLSILVLAPLARLFGWSS